MEYGSQVVQKNEIVGCVENIRRTMLMVVIKKAKPRYRTNAIAHLLSLRL